MTREEENGHQLQKLQWGEKCKMRRKETKKEDWGEDGEDGEDGEEVVLFHHKVDL